MPQTDAELIRLSLSGDKAAFGNLMERYIALAGSVAMGVLGDFDHASDAVQDSFIKAWTNLASLREVERFKSWLCGIVKTTSIDHLRKNKARVVSLPMDPSEIGKVAGDALVSEPARKLESEELHGKILEAINGLPQKYREVVMLKHIENLSYQEIAKTLGVSNSAVESRLFRGRQMVLDRLRKYLDE
ncbi:MAG: RNA polymerase sigma factor [Planctomycetota bacterium]|nr:MAG: RNA polymerase sigma factor [Planctomycetota bacterium]